ncbi:hypothetical protein BH23ACT6_BH23ACT6_15740 [soil metagenome]
MAHKHPGGGVDPHRPMGMDSDSYDPQQAAAEEEEWYGDLLPFFRVIDTVVKTVMVILLVVLIFAVGTNVFGRFVLNTSMPGSSELSRFLFIWVIFLGAALAHLHNEHIAVTLFVERLSPSVQRWVVVLQELIILVVVGALLISSWQVLSIDPGTSPLLGVPLLWVNVAVPFSAGLMAVITLYRIAGALRSPERTAV